LHVCSNACATKHEQSRANTSKRERTRASTSEHEQARAITSDHGRTRANTSEHERTRANTRQHEITKGSEHGARETEHVNDGLHRREGSQRAATHSRWVNRDWHLTIIAARSAVVPSRRDGRPSVTATRRNSSRCSASIASCLASTVLRIQRGRHGDASNRHN
jgi:hypothetical protein